MDYLLSPDAVENYDAAWNYREEKLKFCFNLRGQAINDYAETLYNLLVQYVGTSGTGINTVSRHTKSKNRRKCYLEIKGNIKTEAYEETKASKANNIVQSAHYDGNRKSTFDNYYNLAAN